MMKLETYKNIMSIIEKFQGRNYKCEELLQEKFPDILPATLGSIYETFYQKKMKKNHAKYNRLSKDLYRSYKTGVKNGDAVGILLRMSDEIDLSPALLARMMVEEYYREAEDDYIIPKAVDDSDNSDRLMGDDTECALTDNGPTDSSSRSNTDMKKNDEVEKSTKKSVESIDLKKMSIKSLDDKSKVVNKNVETKGAKKKQVYSGKQDSNHSRERDKDAGSSRINNAEKINVKWKNTSRNNDECTRIIVKDLISDTTLIKDKDLAYEVFLCHVEDDQYGPVMDCYRKKSHRSPSSFHSVHLLDLNYKQTSGHQYEVYLAQWVEKNGLVVQDEAALRKFGFDKTPDVKLDMPIAVNGTPIMWIESKAIFADEEIHNTYYNDQYIRYWNRFGPGLVIYWLGYLETITTTDEKRIMICYKLPIDIKKYDPKAVKMRKFTERPFGMP